MTLKIQKFFVPQNSFFENSKIFKNLDLIFFEDGREGALKIVRDFYELLLGAFSS